MTSRVLPSYVVATSPILGISICPVTVSPGRDAAGIAWPAPAKGSTCDGATGSAVGEGAGSGVAVVGDVRTSKPGTGPSAAGTLRPPHAPVRPATTVTHAMRTNRRGRTVSVTSH